MCLFSKNDDLYFENNRKIILLADVFFQGEGEGLGSRGYLGLQRGSKAYID